MDNHTTSSTKTNQAATNIAPTATPNDEDLHQINDPTEKEPTAESNKSIPKGNHSAAREDAESLEPGEIPYLDSGVLMATEAPGSSKEASADPQLETDPDEDSDEGSSSSSLHATPIKNPRGRKSKKKKREEATYLAILVRSQKTLKGIMNTRSKKGTAPAPKRAIPTQSN